MQKLFNNILVPVDFSDSSLKLVQKASDIAYQYNCNIHLLHVVTPSVFSFLPFGDSYMYVNVPGVVIDNRKELEAEMEKYCSVINDRRREENVPAYTILKGTWNDAILNIIEEQQIDLVLIGQQPVISKRKVKINPDKIAFKKNIPVITIPLNRNITPLRSILIPVTDFLPVRKLIYGIYMASVYEATLKLVGIENKNTKNSVGHFLKKAYGLIKDNCDVPVSLVKVKSENIAGAVNEFASRTSADLVIVNPGTQTRMPGFLSTLWGNILQRYSPLPVLTVSPL